MWKISEVKRTAKEAFLRSYWGCVVVALILSFLATGSAMSGSSSGMKQAIDQMEQSGLSSDELMAVEAFLLSFGIILTIIWSAMRIFLLNPLEVGCHAYLKDNIEGDTSMNRLGEGFANYGRVILTIFLRDLFLALWFCLLVIPGIVKGYSYMMVPYILLDNPELKGTEAITKSRHMMKGNKWRAFLLDLSFIGWMLLSLITCGLVGVFYEQPYRMSAKAALYHELKKSA